MTDTRPVWGEAFLLRWMGRIGGAVAVVLVLLVMAGGEPAEILPIVGIGALAIVGVAAVTSIVRAATTRR